MVASEGEPHSHSELTDASSHSCPGMIVLASESMSACVC